MKKAVLLPGLAMLASVSTAVYSGTILAAEATSDVSLNLAAYAEITELQDITMEVVASDTNGAANAVFEGGSSFRVETNDFMIIQVAGDDLTHAGPDVGDSIPTEFLLDGTAGGTVNVDPNHNNLHTLGVRAVLGNISDQRAGNYETTVTVTVSPI